MEPAVSVEDLTKLYKTGRKSRVKAIDHLSLEIFPQQVFGFLGPNGSGKTTLSKILLGLVFPTSGKGWVLGKKCGHIQTKKRIGFLAENAYFYDFLSGEELLYFSGSIFGIPKTELKSRIAELLKITRLTEDRGRKLREYSKGMLQRIGIARALINDPDLLILDEPASGLDPLGQKEMREVILNVKQRGKTIILNSHHLSEMGTLCDSIAILNKGRKVKGGRLSELLRKEDSIEIVGQQIKEELWQKIQKKAKRVAKRNSKFYVFVPNYSLSNEIVREICDSGGTVLSVNQEKISLEELFIQTIK